MQSHTSSLTITITTRLTMNLNHRPFFGILALIFCASAVLFLRLLPTHPINLLGYWGSLILTILFGYCFILTFPWRQWYANLHRPPSN